MGANASTPKVVEMKSTSECRAKLEASKQSNTLLVVDFTATWCGPCKSMETVIEDYATMYADVQFVMINVDTLADVAREFNVDAMPTFVLFKKGQEVERIVGTKKAELQKMIEKHRI